jgi:hypothetical protein
VTRDCRIDLNGTVYAFFVFITTLLLPYPPYFSPSHLFTSFLYLLTTNTDPSRLVYVDKPELLLGRRRILTCKQCKQGDTVPRVTVKIPEPLT